MKRRTSLAALAAAPSILSLPSLWTPARAATPQAASPASAAASAPGAASDFDAWSEAFAGRWVRSAPESATWSRYFDGAEQRELDGQLSLDSDEQRQSRLSLAREGLAGLRGFEAAALTRSQRAGAATMRWSLQRHIDGQPFADHHFAFAQNDGVHIRLVNLLSETQPLRRAADVAPWLSRMAQGPSRIDHALARSRRAVARGLVPPRFIVERSRGQVQALLQGEGVAHPMWQAAQRRLSQIADLDDAARDRALDRAARLLADEWRPAWQRLAAWLDELLPQARETAGWGALPDGEAAYAQALARHTTSSLSADEVHRIGLREVARLEGRLDEVLRRLDLRDGTVPQRLAQLRQRLQPPADPDPRAALIERYTRYVRDAERRAEPLFRLRPAAPVEVRRVPALTERTASAYYTTPTPDGTRPGIFWAPLPGPVFDIPRMRSLAVHEAVPGHHFQLALQMEETGLPRWRRLRIFSGGSAHSEGWGLYAEQLALEQGWYDDDPPSLAGALDGLLFRARRLVVDTGLHAKGWTRQQAIDYGLPAHEVERYVSNPGQACAYMIGMQRIVALREQARQAMGARFSLPGFHDVVLRTGSVPLDVLAEVVSEWQAAAS